MLFIVFSKFGSIISLKIARDFETRRSKGFGFVTYGN
jgi:RNA recognition motif-containing protein